MKRQDNGAWPNTFRQAQLIPAVEYIEANRIRTLLIRAMADTMKDIALNGGGVLYALDMRAPPADGEYPIVCSACGALSWESDECVKIALRYWSPTSGPSRFTWVGSCIAQNTSRSWSNETRAASNVTCVTSACPVVCEHTSR